MGLRRKNSESEKFCFCIGLTQSIITSSVLWLVEGFVMVSWMIISVVSSNNDNIFEYRKPLSFTLLLHFATLTALSVFGLGSLLIYKSTEFMIIYKWLAWIFAVFLNAIMGIITLVLVIIDQLSICSDVYNNCERNANDQDTCTEEFSRCRQGANSIIVWACIAIMFQCLMHLYFTVILRAYVRLRVDKEKIEKRSRVKKSASTTKVPKKLLLKIDKTYDDMNQML